MGSILSGKDTQEMQTAKYSSILTKYLQVNNDRIFFGTSFLYFMASLH